MAPSQIQLQLWEQQVYEFGITLPLPEMPKPTADWGGLGLNLKLTCPGAALCGNPDADTNCSIEIIQPLKIPGFLIALPIPELKLPPMKVRVVVPPKVILPVECPAYPKEEAQG